jgi:hypothetical protein
MQQSEVASNQAEGYTVLPAVNNIILGFTKESSEGLPITSTRITGTQPCILPTENYKGENSTFWMGELSWMAKGWAGCTSINKGTDVETNVDPRYKKAGL